MPGLDRPGDELGVLVTDRPQPILDPLLQTCVEGDEPRQRAGLAVLGDADAAGADVLKLSGQLLAGRQRARGRAADQHAVH